MGLTAVIPTWISEGFATYLFWSESEKLAPVLHPISFQNLSEAQGYPPFERAFYEQSGKWVGYLVQRFGMEKFIAFSYLLSTGTTLENAFLEIYPKGYEEIKKQIDETQPAQAH